MAERRRSIRTQFDSRVKITHPEKGEAIFRTGDVSDGGIYVIGDGMEMRLGDQVSVQIQNVPTEAPVVTVRVVRKTGEGYGLQFATF